MGGLLIPRTRLAIASYAGGAAYSAQVLATRAGNLIGYWPLWEASGSTADDQSSQENDGSYTGVTLGQSGIGDGRTCPYFDGANDYVDLYSAGFLADFNGNEGSLMAWWIVNGAAVWTDGSQNDVVLFYVNSSNWLGLYKNSPNNMFTFNRKANGDQRRLDYTMSDLGWNHTAMTWSDSGNQLIRYLNGSQVDVVETTVETWSGSPDSKYCAIGAQNVGGGCDEPWHGKIAHVALWNTPLSASEVAALAVV
ncbi:MAG: hypothetical protein JSW37_13255 [Anaerolineales bacterium]|nr:MAG: hypothetical protein JSW37_13255 [Anaerolineales bacterium]